jgi:ABC-2 type transport system ATP-binding protein
MADRIGVINKGGLIVVEDKEVLMRKLGKKAAHPHFAAAHVQHPRRAKPLVV